MISIQKGEDLLSIFIHNVLSYRKDDQDFINLVLNWNKKILINFEDFYCIELLFEGNEIRYKVNDLDNKVDLKVSLNIYTVLDLAYGRLNPVKAFIKRKLKIKGIYKVGTMLRFIKIFLKAMQMVALDPNINYFELNKDLK
ncbi:MAG: SCP2 sterol-binding domain-containing protein [Candidatus Hermodarchaeota archaeon]